MSKLLKREMTEIRAECKSQSAYDHIKEMILSGELAPRIDISEKQLQQELGSAAPLCMKRSSVYRTRAL